MITFDKAWRTLAIGRRVRISNGQPRPGGDGLAFKVWRSHNFEGVIVERIKGPPRAIRVEEDEADDALVSFSITEASGDTFEPV